MKQWLLILAIFLGGCGDGFKPVKIYSVPPELQPYVNLFLYEAEQRGFDYTIDNLIMDVNDSLNNTNTLGTCQVFIHPIIIINADFFNVWGTLVNKEQVIFHEFGHCLLGRDHDNRQIAHNGEIIPSSIMNKYMFHEYYYSTYRDYYLDELFGVL